MEVHTIFQNGCLVTFHLEQFFCKAKNNMFSYKRHKTFQENTAKNDIEKIYLQLNPEFR